MFVRLFLWWQKEYFIHILKGQAYTCTKKVPKGRGGSMKRAWVIVALLIMCMHTMPNSTYAQMNNVSAHNAVLMEEHSGRVLYGKREHEPQKIASITKIMTALLVAESGKNEGNGLY